MSNKKCYLVVVASERPIIAYYHLSARPAGARFYGMVDSLAIIFNGKLYLARLDVILRPRKHHTCTSYIIIHHEGHNYVRYLVRYGYGTGPSGTKNIAKDSKNIAGTFLVLEGPIKTESVVIVKSEPHKQFSFWRENLLTDGLSIRTYRFHLPHISKISTVRRNNSARRSKALFVPF